MRHEVRLVGGAERDLREIHDYIARFDSEASAERVLDGILAIARDLGAFPHRGIWPPEPLALGIREFRQVHFKPYRVIYRVAGGREFIYLIADGRRDMQPLLARRLLSA